MGIFSKLFGKAEDKAPEVTEEIDRIYTDIMDRGRDVNDVFIAGVSHHCTRKDVGFFTGYIFNEKDNPHDKKAMAIFDHQKGRIIGYVPSAILENYRDWCKKKRCVCVGFIFYNGEMLRGRARAYLPDSDKELMMEDIADYAKQVCEFYGWPVPSFTEE